MIDHIDAGVRAMSPVIGAPRPRALLHGLSEEEAEIVREIAGSVQVIEEMGGAHAEEHDVLILGGAHFHHYRQGYPRRLVFGPAAELVQPRFAVASGFDRGSGPTYTTMYTQFRPARDFEITDDSQALGLTSLVMRSCKPVEGPYYTGFRLPVNPVRAARPLLKEALDSPLTLAAILESHDEDGNAADSAIWLPDIARSAFREWVNFAFGFWREQDPERFPLSADWMSEDRWASPGEISARREIAAFEQAEAARLEAIDNERRALTAAVESAEGAGETWRAMLTTTADELVTAVKEAFELIGFAVQDADELPQHKSAKREDLRVSDGDWTALVEVKGYTGAAKSNDLSQVTRAAVFYAISEGKAPDALWYVPNPERETAPASRNVALVGREDDLTAFADDHRGCLIDTRDLFALRQRVVNGATSAEDARQELKSASGRYTA